MMCLQASLPHAISKRQALVEQLAAMQDSITISATNTSSTIASLRERPNTTTTSST